MNFVHTSFILRKNKINKAGKCPIYLRITVDNRRKEVTTKKYIEPSKWNVDKQQVKGNTPTSNAINRVLDEYRRKVLEAETELIKERKPVTASTIKDALLNKNEKHVDLFKYIELHNERMKELIGKEYSNSTYKKYTTCLGHLKDFVKNSFNQAEFSIHRVNLSFIKAFEHYLKTKSNPCSHNSTLKYISHLKKVIREAIAEEILAKDPYLRYKETYETKAPRYLADHELQAIEEKQIEIDRIDRVRDMFLFCCYTGLSYSDVEVINKSDIEVDKDGNNWLVVNRQKTNEPSFILLLKKALDIIEKYSNDPETQDGNLLPILSNQKMNAYLKEIADICSIRKNLTFHMARHTFATTVALENGIPISTIQKILGHKDSRSTQVYAKVTRRKVRLDMLKLDGM
ncbi:MAG: site-specific integrase [Balneolaceae bacterium]|nr:site-specific integrase [Balneolaceae bacterium]